MWAYILRWPALPQLRNISRTYHLSQNECGTHCTPPIIEYPFDEQIQTINWTSTDPKRKIRIPRMIHIFLTMENNDWPNAQRRLIYIKVQVKWWKESELSLSSNHNHQRNQQSTSPTMASILPETNNEVAVSKNFNWILQLLKLSSSSIVQRNRCKSIRDQEDHCPGNVGHSPAHVQCLAIEVYPPSRR